MLSRWEPFVGINRLQTELNRLFDQWGVRTPQYAQSAFPPLNVWEDGDAYFVEAELPGLSLDDLEIYVSAGNQLSIKGDRKQPALEKGTWHRREREFGSFSRMVELPAEVDADRVSAEFRDGVLTITLPKSKETKPRKIAVKAS
jgi:HSP20 family protein